MFSINEMPSPSSMFSAYASLSASMMLYRSMVNEFIPQSTRNYFFTKISYLFKPHTPNLTLVIEEPMGMNRNEVFDAASTYLGTIISPKTERLKVSKSPQDKNFKLELENGEELVDFYEEIELHWRFVRTEQEQSKKRDRNSQMSENQTCFFELRFLKKHQDLVIASYLPFILERAKAIKNEQRFLKMHTLSGSRCYDGVKWDSVNLTHPATFETLAMEMDVKKAVMEDLNMFLKRKEFYKRVGRAWKRGYLLYGPPGTGKSTFVAAMANYLKFDIYDLQLSSIIRDSDLRRVLLSIKNRSILVIEDIDCSIDIPDRKVENSEMKKQQDQQDSTPTRAFLTLSGLLNFVDGLWSSCGDERIIIFTTNHKDRLDPALLRPGRMDMHIHLSYCTFQGFKTLASNYLEIYDQHNLFGEIESLMKETEVTPAQVAEELMTSEVADIALERVVKLLKRKKLESDECEGKNGNKVNAYRNVKRQNI